MFVRVLNTFLSSVSANQNFSNFAKKPHLFVTIAASEKQEQGYSLQTHHLDSKLKRRGNGRFHVYSTWNSRGVFAGLTITETTQKLRKR